VDGGGKKSKRKKKIFQHECGAVPVASRQHGEKKTKRKRKKVGEKRESREDKKGATTYVTCMLGELFNLHGCIKRLT